METETENQVENGKVDAPPDRDSSLLEFPNPSGRNWRQKPEDEAPARKRPGRPKGSTNQRKRIRDALAAQFTMVGVAATAFNAYDGSVILSQAENLADQTIKLGDEYPSVMKALESLTTASLIGGVVMSYLAVALPILANHGFVPEIVVNFLDVPPLPEEVNVA